MPEPPRAPVVECLQCGKQFEPRKSGHVFWSSGCRHRGPNASRMSAFRSTRRPLIRLFDDRPDDERVGEDEWFLGPPEFAALYASERSASAAAGIEVLSPGA